MKILGIETSCDETAISVIEAQGDLDNLQFNLLSNVISSQIKIHAEWGGVVPNLANREHQNNLITVLIQALEEARLLKKQTQKNEKDEKQISKILNREPILLEHFLKEIPKIEIPDIDAIAITVGPGLEPALWVGVNFARTLSIVWNKPIVAVNHMEGHILASLLSQKNKIIFPAIALLVSGGHTQIVLIKNWMDYEIIGQTRDDAVGEAFDKVAKILGLGYPGGPAVSAQAEQFSLIINQFTKTTKTKFENCKKENSINPSPNGDDCKLKINFPRPMINSNDFDFSFSGLKTAVLYKVKDLNLAIRKPGEREKLIQEVCYGFQQACIDVLVSKTKKTIEKYDAKTLIVGGGVSANKELRDQIQIRLANTPTSNSLDIKILLPEIKFTGDNGAMIAIAGYLQILKNPNWKNADPNTLKANGNLNF